MEVCKFIKATGMHNFLTRKSNFPRGRKSASFGVKPRQCKSRRWRVSIIHGRRDAMGALASELPLGR